MLKFKLLLARIINLSINFIFIRTHFRSRKLPSSHASHRLSRMAIPWRRGLVMEKLLGFVEDVSARERGEGSLIIDTWNLSSLTATSAHFLIEILMERSREKRRDSPLLIARDPSTNSIETREKEGGVSKLKLSLVNTPLYAATITREWNFAPSIEGKKKRWRDPSSSSYLTDRDIGRGWWIVGERLAEARRRGGIRKFTVKSCANGSKVTHFRFIEGEVPFELKELGALANGESSVERERERRIN